MRTRQKQNQTTGFGNVIICMTLIQELKNEGPSVDAEETKQFFLVVDNQIREISLMMANYENAE